MTSDEVEKAFSFNFNNLSDSAEKSLNDMLLFDVKNGSRGESPSTASMSSTSSLSPCAFPFLEDSNALETLQDKTSSPSERRLDYELLNVLCASGGSAFADLWRIAWMKDGYSTAYSKYDQILMNLSPRTLVTNTRPDEDEAHCKRLKSGQGTCQSFRGVVLLVSKQERVKEAVPASEPNLRVASIGAMSTHDERLLKAKELRSKPGKMSLVEESSPQPQFAKAVRSSVSTRRKEAEKKHLARIARARCRG